MESAWSNGKPAYRCRHGHHRQRARPRASEERVRIALSARPPGEPADGLPVLKGARGALLEGLASWCRELTAKELTAL